MNSLKIFICFFLVTLAFFALVNILGKAFLVEAKSKTKVESNSKLKECKQLCQQEYDIWHDACYASKSNGATADSTFRCRAIHRAIGNEICVPRCELEF